MRLPIHRLSRPPGFTLIEVLMVILIIAILSALVLRGAGFVTRQSKIKTCVAQLQRVASAIDAYHRDTGNLPDNWNSWGTFDLTHLLPKYLSSAELTDPWGSRISAEWMNHSGSARDPKDIHDMASYVGSIGYRITSRGPDRQINTTDDLTQAFDQM